MEVIRHSKFKQIIPFRDLIDDDNEVNTKKYGILTENQLYWGYFLPYLVKSYIKNKINLNKNLPFKVYIEIDEERLKGLSEREQEFFKDAVDRKAWGRGQNEKESEIFKMVSTDLVYLF